MSKELENIFDGHYDKKIDFNYDKTRIVENVMTKEAFVKIVSKMLDHKSNGTKFKDLKELQNYYLKD